MQGSALIEGTHTETMIKIPLKAIKEMARQMAEVKEVSKIKEEDNHSRRHEILGMNLTLLRISKMNISTSSSIYYFSPGLTGKLVY